MTLREWLRKKVLGFLGIVEQEKNPKTDDRLTFINDAQKIQLTKLREYNMWYSGDSDELLNFYTRKNMIDYNYEPYFARNKTAYFWAVSSTEDDIKRTHSGQPRNIVDTMVNIVGQPTFKAGVEQTDKALDKILKDNSFSRILAQKQMPLTMVEGWGCYKINWDTDLRDTPIILYYRAENVDFIYKSNQIIGIIFKDYYKDEKGLDYLLIETRRTERRKDEVTGAKFPSLIIEKELFQLGDGDALMPIEIKDFKQLSDTEPRIEITNYGGLLASPCIFFEDTTAENTGRSIFTGKIDLFDDLDQCLSQSSNTVRRSTTKEYFNTNFLERDRETGMPIMPAAFDRKYTMFAGGKDANGVAQGTEPVQVTQPQLNFEQYNQEATNILVQIISGIMSPATLGIDVAKKDNADAQREKEKVTIFTRNAIISEETSILKTLFRELLCAQELINRGEVTFKDYDVSVKFDEFADVSFENKVDSLLTLFNAGVLTPEQFVERLYKDSLSEKEKQFELDFIKEGLEGANEPPFEEGEDDLAGLKDMMDDGGLPPKAPTTKNNYTEKPKK